MDKFGVKRYCGKVRTENLIKILSQSMIAMHFINFSTTAIPIHTLPQKMDHNLAMKRSCPRYHKAWMEYIESDEIKSVFEKNRSLIEYVEMHAGMRFKTIPSIKAVYEALWIEELKGFT